MDLMLNCDECHADMTKEEVKHVKPKPWPADAAQPFKGNSSLQHLSMDPTGVAAAPLQDLKAWTIIGTAKVSILF